MITAGSANVKTIMTIVMLRKRSNNFFPWVDKQRGQELETKGERERARKIEKIEREISVCSNGPSLYII